MFGKVDLELENPEILIDPFEEAKYETKQDKIKKFKKRKII